MKIMKNELTVFTSNDLVAAGINSQLSSNDLVEVVAHDIYDKYLDSINAVIVRGKELQGGYKKLMDAEFGKMKQVLSKYFKGTDEINNVDESEIEYDEMEGISASFGKVKDYWPSLNISSLSIREKDKGTVIESGYHSISLPILKDKNAQVKLTLATGNKYDTKEINTGSIKGEIETTIKKTFTQIVNISTTRFKVFKKEVEQYNKEVLALMDFLPKNGALSVERFTREARVKMNKKIISAQSPEFRKKISELFSIKL